MKRASNLVIVLITAPKLTTARKLSRVLLENKAVACVNIVPGLESHYWWQGKLDRANEVLLIAKTSRSRLPALEKLVLTHHPYDTPEIIALPIESGTPHYVQWLESSL